MLLSPGKVRPAQQKHAVGGVQPDVSLVPAQALQIVVLRQVGGVAVLLQMQTGEIQLLAGGDLRRVQRGLGRFRHGLHLLFPRGAGQNPAAVCIGEGEGQRMGGLGSGQALFKNLRGRQGHRALQQHFVSGAKGYPGVFQNAGGVNADPGLAILHIQPQHCFGAGVLHAAHLFVGHEILGEGLFLKGGQPGEVGLVVGKHAGHQLDVRAVLVGEVPVPGLAEVAAAPDPLLFAGET